MKTILAIDPGPESSQVLTWQNGRVADTSHMDNGELLRYIRGSAKHESWFTVAIEMIACYGMPVGKEVFETCYIIGRLIEICDGKIPVTRVYRKDVKLALCGTARAKDANVRQALIDLLGPPGTKKAPGPTYGVSGHGWSCLAIAYHASKQLEAK